MVETLIPREDTLRSHHGPSSIRDGARRTTPSVEWSRSPARPALQVSSALDRVRHAPTILAAMQISPGAARFAASAISAGARPADVLPPIVEAIRDEGDTVTAVAAIHALGRVPGGHADAEIRRLVEETLHGFDAHILWAMEARPFSAGLLEPVTQSVARGGLAGMHAQRALARWAATAADLVLATLLAVLRSSSVASSRRYLSETIGLVPGTSARQALEVIACDPSEEELVRAEAIAAFADRATEPLPAAIGRLAARTSRVGEAVHTVRARRVLARRGLHVRHERRAGIKVAQVHLGAVLDPEATRAGMGDTGGVATLLPRLGAALTAQRSIHEVVTIGRSVPGEPGSRIGFARTTQGGHHIDAVPLEAGEGASFASAWPSVLAGERGIHSALLASGRPDLIHLRMADPGSLAAASVARRYGIATVFTLALDPHGPIAAAERAGNLDRRTFASRDAGAALWFRATLAERLAREARELVLFPRPRLRQQLTELVGLDVVSGPPRHTVVAEGVDVRQADRAVGRLTSLPPDREAPVVHVLRAAIGRLPSQRKGLPIVLSVGRMHETKGMARIVEAFALDDDLAASANLVIVGGDLRDPSSAEAAELARIKVLFDRHGGLRQRVVLLGHQPHADANLLMAVARHGWGGMVAPGGAYVCGSFKEEFGLAIVEAMAAGLPVVAPLAGGPATYVDSGATGWLVDTADPRAIARGIRAALVLARDPGTAERTRTLVETRFTLDRMARTLAAVYRVTAAAQSLALPVDTGLPAAASPGLAA